MIFIFSTYDFLTCILSNLLRLMKKSFEPFQHFASLAGNALIQQTKYKGLFLWLNIEFSSRLLRACLGVTLYLIIFEKIVWVGLSM